MELISEQETISKEEVIKEIKTKFPKTQIFMVEIPFHGYFAFRPQELKDVKESAKKVEDYLKAKVKELGGSTYLDKLPDDEKNGIIRSLDIDAGEISTSTTLTQCVLYPFDFSEKIANDKIAAGLGPTLIQKITEVSGWGDISVDEI